MNVREAFGGGSALNWNRAALALASAAIVSSLLALAGWILDQPLLAGFGFAAYPEWPVNALALTALATAMIALHRGAGRGAAALLLLPAGVGVFALGAYILGTASPLDGLLVPPHAGASLPNRGRPSVFAATALLLLSLGVVLATSSRRGTRIAAQVVAAAALGLSALSICVDLLRLEIIAQHVRLPASLPAAVAAGLLALAVMSWRARDIWRRRLLQTPAGRTMAALTALAVIPSLILPVVEQVGKSATLSTLEIVLVASSLYVALAVLVWGGAAATALRDRQALDDLISALNTVPVLLVAPDGRIVHWSEGCEALLDLPADRVVGTAIGTVLPGFAVPEGSRARRSPIQRLKAVDAAGQPVALLARAETIETAGGRLLAVALNDAGTLAETRAALQRSEAALQMALDAHMIAVFDWVLPTGELTWSAAAEERLGLEPGEMREFAMWQTLVHPEDREPMERVVATALESRVPRFSFRYRLVGRAGQVRTIEGTGQFFFAPDGTPLRCTGINIDVTERDRREMALVASEAQLRAMIETVPDAMIVIDEAGQMQSLSRTAERLFGIDAEQAVGKNVSMLMPEPWAAEHDRYLDNYLQTGVRKVIGRRRELFARRSDGSEMPIELNVGEAWVGDRRLFVGFVRDISGRVEAERHLEELNAAYAHSARLNAVGEIAASLAHELNQPLAASSNFLAAAEVLLERSPENTQATEFLAQAGDQILRAGEIIRRLRDFIAKTDTEMQIVLLAPMLQEALELGLTGSRQLRIDTAFDLDPEAPTFLGDRIQIEQVIVNLVRNSAQALAATPPGERCITLATRRDGDMVRISVADTGPGLPPAVLDQLAKPFMTTKGEQGLGLGISICRRIVEAHGGLLNAANDETGGARFEFTVPIGDITMLGED